jgi:hypothetical protein
MQKMIVLSCLILLGTAFLPGAQASEWDQKTIFTFSGPSEIPGRVLPAGTYVFTLMDSLSDRDIVQIWEGRNQSKLLATILAIPDERMKPASKPIVTFEERAAGSPPAVQTWFYPGRVIGEEFVYPKTKAIELAKRTNQPVLSMPNEEEASISKPSETAAAELKKAPLKAVKPSGEEEEVAQVVKTPTPAELAPPAPTQMAQAAMPKTLPKTASELPLVALIGLLSLCCAGALRLAWKRMV